MIRILLAVLITFSCLSLSAQELSKKETKTINKRLDSYVKLIKKEDYNALMNLIYPKIFEVATKEQMIEVFNSLEAQGFDMIFEEMKITSLKPVSISTSASYVLCPYDMKMKVALVNKEMQNPEVANSMLEAFKMVYSTGTVSLDKENYTFQIAGKKHLMAIQNSDYGKDWYFAEFDQSNPMLLNMMFPEEVIKKTKELVKD
ncbi:hypothetical protein OB69_04355 [Roseivirga seohaensis subsp. aquiponti]|uniref:DUF4476 domain-containing protein n=1 Tax=Roseivirga seohaensis subsp. aquiponti TaxID=1566026 RepID=A0A0L8ANP7_9BACT|nr:hypothetical protein [Roseivirga seohaensis]KOF03797.1 hypothetical protein OB69_04355 [Roseivirga seohaensis subsp. aquiponti]